MPSSLARKNPAPAHAHALFLVLPTRESAPVFLFVIPARESAFVSLFVIPARESVSRRPFVIPTRESAFVFLFVIPARESASLRPFVIPARESASVCQGTPRSRSLGHCGCPRSLAFGDRGFCSKYLSFSLSFPPGNPLLSLCLSFPQGNLFLAVRLSFPPGNPLLSGPLAAGTQQATQACWQESAPPGRWPGHQWHLPRHEAWSATERCAPFIALCDERAGDVSSLRFLVFTPSGNWFPRPNAVHCEPITTVSLASDVSRGGRRWKQRKVMKRRDSAWRNRFRPLGMDLSSPGHDLKVNARSSQSAMNGAQLSRWTSLVTGPPACAAPILG
jgi:hypothetical protein